MKSGPSQSTVSQLGFTGHREHKNEDIESEENKDREINAEDTAESSEELVITKVEDCMNEMAVDQNEDYNEKMEVDGPADSGNCTNDCILLGSKSCSFKTLH